MRRPGAREERLFPGDFGLTFGGLISLAKVFS
jgi:hypothetical protein